MEILIHMLLGWLIGNFVLLGLFGALLHWFLFGDDPEDKPEALPSDPVPRLDIRDIP